MDLRVEQMLALHAVDDGDRARVLGGATWEPRTFVAEACKRDGLPHLLHGRCCVVDQWQRRKLRCSGQGDHRKVRPVPDLRIPGWVDADIPARQLDALSE